MPAANKYEGKNAGTPAVLILNHKTRIVRPEALYFKGKERKCYCAGKIVARDILDTIFQFSAHHTVRSHLTDVTNIRKAKVSHLVTFANLKSLLVVKVTVIPSWYAAAMANDSSSNQDEMCGFVGVDCGLGQVILPCLDGRV